MKRFTPLAVSLALLAWGHSSQAQFGSAPLNAPSNPPAAAVQSAPPAALAIPQAPPAQAAVGTSIPQTYNSGSSSAYAPAPVGYAPPAPPPSPTQPVVGPDKKWVRDERGARYVVSKTAILPQGWSEIPGPQTAPGQPAMTAPQQMTPAYTPPNPAQGYPQPPQQAATYYQPQQQASLAGDGMKTIEDQSGYRIKVAKDSPIPPGFREVAAVAAQPAPPPGYGVPQQMAPQQQVPTYQSQPNVYSSAPSVPNVPPTWQQQLPYQPPAPTFQNPTGPYMNQGMQPQPVPVVRSAPPGKKRVTDNSGLVYYVDQDTIIGPGMREVTEAEMNQPPAFMMQQQQPQQRQGFMSRLFGG